MTPGVSCFSQKQVVRMGFYTPALFLASGQRASGVHVDLRGWLYKPSFFGIML
jgi:hypothetical protein